MRTSRMKKQRWKSNPKAAKMAMIAMPRGTRGIDCVAARNKDPVFGVIGIQSGPWDKGPQRELERRGFDVVWSSRGNGRRRSRSALQGLLRRSRAGRAVVVGRALG